MNYKQIDKQFEDRFSFLKTVVEKMGNKNIYWYDELKSFLHLIYDQAKAEQREECKKLMAQSNEWWNKKLKEATAIRQEGEE